MSLFISNRKKPSYAQKRKDSVKLKAWRSPLQINVFSKKCLYIWAFGQTGCRKFDP